MIVNGLNPDLLIAYDRQPDDFTLVGAMADYAREQGAEEVAEFFDWVREKRRFPVENVYIDGCWGWYVDNQDLSTVLPEHLREKVCEDVTGSRDNPHHQLLRLMRLWNTLSEVGRRQCWQWEPPVRYVLPEQPIGKCQSEY